jgi:hypothetical protein
MGAGGGGAINLGHHRVRGAPESTSTHLLRYHAEAAKLSPGCLVAVLNNTYGGMGCSLYKKLLRSTWQ